MVGRPAVGALMLTLTSGSDNLARMILGHVVLAITSAISASFAQCGPGLAVVLRLTQYTVPPGVSETGLDLNLHSVPLGLGTRYRYCVQSE